MGVSVWSYTGARSYYLGHRWFPRIHGSRWQMGAELAPHLCPIVPTQSWLGIDTFPGTKLSVEWEWNQNPNTSYYSVNDGLTLRTATNTTDLFKACNTLTHRVFGPISKVTVAIDTSGMADGDSMSSSSLPRLDRLYWYRSLRL